jgi:hypothetical protein
MRYLLAIHTDEAAESKTNPEEQAKVWQAYMKYTDDLKNAGVLIGGEPLLPSAHGTKVRVRNGKRSVVDGPFSEAKEVLGGYYVLECKSLQEASEWAARCPGAAHGTLEVRQIMDMPKER